MAHQANSLIHRGTVAFLTVPVPRSAARKLDWKQRWNLGSAGAWCAHTWARRLPVKNTVTLDIAGASYRMQVDADETHLRKLAEIVNQRVQALGPKALQRATPAQLLVMVALGLADDWQSAESRSRTVEESTRRAL